MVISGVEVDGGVPVVLVGDIDVGVVVVGVAVVVTVVVCGAGCVDVAGAVDTAMLLAELAGAVSPSNWLMPKTANAATAAAADTPKGISGDPSRRRPT
jgi:hypothetical protein